MSNFEPSKYQRSVFDFISEGEGSAVVEACAGSGKTTTIVQALKLIPEDMHIVFCAFNKRIAEELAKHTPKHVDVRTLHSLGARTLYRERGKPKLENSKTRDIMRDKLFESFEGEYGGNEFKIKREISAIMAEKGTDFARIISFAKSNLVHPNRGNILAAIAEDLEVTLNGDSDIELLQDIYHTAMTDTDVIDFDDMIFLPTAYNWLRPEYDYVFVDEAQDLNIAQIKMVTSILAPNGRMVAVGDRRQAIYAFRGADSKAMDKLKQATNAIELPLSICYRCPKEVVRLAQTLAPEIETFENAPEGHVSAKSLSEVIRDAKPHDFILSRINASLMSVAFKLIRSGKKAVVLGHDVGRNLIKLIEQLADTGERTWDKKPVLDQDVHALKVATQEWIKINTEEMIAQNKHGRAAAIRDKGYCLLELTGVAKTVSEIVTFIEEAFTNDSEKEAVILSSIHKAKGLEAKNVYVMRKLLPHPYAFRSKNPEDLVQEKNLEYVAYTRAQENLYIIPDEQAQEDEDDFDNNSEGNDIPKEPAAGTGSEGSKETDVQEQTRQGEDCKSVPVGRRSEDSPTPEVLDRHSSEVQKS